MHFGCRAALQQLRAGACDQAVVNTQGSQLGSEGTYIFRSAGANQAAAARQAVDRRRRGGRPGGGTRGQPSRPCQPARIAVVWAGAVPVSLHRRKHPQRNVRKGERKDCGCRLQCRSFHPLPSASFDGIASGPIVHVPVCSNAFTVLSQRIFLRELVIRALPFFHCCNVSSCTGKQ